MFMKLAICLKKESRQLLRRLIPKQVTMSTSITMRKMSPAELQDRRKQGLCYNCDEKFSPGHRCKKLFFIDACLDEDGDVIMFDNR